MEFTGERVIPSCYHSTRELFYWHLSRYQFSKSYIYRNDTVLDIACGTGYGSYEIGSLCKEVYAVDIDEKTVEYAQKHFNAGNINFVKGNCTEIDSIIIDKKVNVAISFETIEHLTDQDQKTFLQKLTKILAEDGVFIVSTPNKDLYSYEEEEEENPFHLNELNLEDFVKLLKNYFKDVFIFGQRTFDKSKSKKLGYLLSNSVLDLMKFKVRKPNSQSIIQLSDFEFPTTDIDNCMIFIAVCKNPIK